LPTSRLLQYIHQQAVGTIRMNIAFTSMVVSSVNVSTTLHVTSEPATGGGSGHAGSACFKQHSSESRKVILPGAAKSEAFQSVGHCLFAVIAGLLGAAAR
jgi:hypothetical protein